MQRVDHIIFTDLTDLVNDKHLFENSGIENSVVNPIYLNFNDLFS